MLWPDVGAHRVHGMSESIRPRGTVERTCETCRWSMWFDPLHPSATAVPFVCGECRGDPSPFGGLPTNLKEHLP